MTRHGESMKSFVTGSRRYGTPKKKSDIDLVVLVDDYDLRRLHDMADSIDSHEDGAKYGSESISMRFGKLNLIAVNHTELFRLWRDGTQELAEKARRRGEPIGRKEAMRFFTKLRDKKEV